MPKRSNNEVRRSLEMTLALLRIGQTSFGISNFPPCAFLRKAADFLKSEETLWANFAAKTLQNSGAREG